MLKSTDHCISILYVTSPVMAKKNHPCLLHITNFTPCPCFAKSFTLYWNCKIYNPLKNCVQISLWVEYTKIQTFFHYFQFLMTHVTNYRYAAWMTGACNVGTELESNWNENLRQPMFVLFPLSYVLHFWNVVRSSLSHGQSIFVIHRPSAVNLSFLKYFGVLPVSFASLQAFARFYVGPHYDL